jgi:hypothetical protein
MPSCFFFAALLSSIVMSLGIKIRHEQNAPHYTKFVNAAVSLKGNGWNETDDCAHIEGREVADTLFRNLPGYTLVSILTGFCYESQSASYLRYCTSVEDLIQENNTLRSIAPIFPGRLCKVFGFMAFTDVGMPSMCPDVLMPGLCAFCKQDTKASKGCAKMRPPFTTPGGVDAVLAEAYVLADKHGYKCNCSDPQPSSGWYF